MKITAIKLVNFSCFKKTKFEFTPGLNVVVLPNGGGKSSLIAGISFSIYGSRILDGSVKTYVREGSVGTPLVQLQGSLNDTPFILKRHLKVSRVSFKWGDVEITKANELTDFWKKRLIPASLFKATICSNQREAALLAQANTATRRKLISELLQFDVVTQAIHELSGTKALQASEVSQEQIEKVEQELAELKDIQPDWEPYLREQIYLQEQLARSNPKVDELRKELTEQVARLSTLHDLLTRVSTQSFSKCPVCGSTSFDSSEVSSKLRKISSDLANAQQQLSQLPPSSTLTEEQKAKIDPKLGIDSCRQTLELISKKRQLETTLANLRELQQRFQQSRRLTEARQLLRDFLDSVSVPLLSTVSRLTSELLVGSPFREVVLTPSFDLEVDGKPFSKLSVGQRDFVATLFRVAVSYVTSSLYNIDHFPLLLDSIGDSLDETFFSLLMSILSTEITKLFPQIILTTHHS